MAAFPQRHELLHKRLERFTRLLPGIEEGDVTALHRARVASRRLRELLPVLQLDHDVASKLGRRLRKIRNRLGAVRELDVLLILIDELHESRRQDRAALKRLSDAVRRDQKNARERLLQKKLPISELKGIARKLSRVQRDLEATEAKQKPSARPGRGWRWALEARIAHRAVKLQASMEAAGAVYLPERLHDVRLDVKKLRYALELSVEAGGTAGEPALRVLKRTQELLGRLNDLNSLIMRIREVQASLNPPNVLAWRELQALSTAIENSSRRLHARYMHERAALAAAIDPLAAGGAHRRAAAKVSGESRRLLHAR